MVVGVDGEGEHSLNHPKVLPGALKVKNVFYKCPSHYRKHEHQEAVHCWWDSACVPNHRLSGGRLDW